MDIKSRLEAIEKRLSLLEQGAGLNGEVSAEKSIVEMDLVLPEDTFGSFHFNETKVHAFFEKKDDGWYHSRDILFLSARNTTDDNAHEFLMVYLNLCRNDGLTKQLAGYFDVHPKDIKIYLPKENEGIKQYNGVNERYWLWDKYSESSDKFRCVNRYGIDDNYYASEAGGCAPVFCVREQLK